MPPGIDSNTVVNSAYERYNLSLRMGLTDVASKVFRIGHLGDLNELMLPGALTGVEMAMLDAGIDVTPGCGVGVVQTYLRDTHAAAR